MEDDGEDHKEEMEAYFSQTEKGRGALAVSRAMCGAVRQLLLDPTLEGEGRKKAEKFLSGHFTVHGGDRRTPSFTSPGEMVEAYRQQAERDMMETLDARDRDPERVAWLKRVREAVLPAVEALREDSHRFHDLLIGALNLTGAIACLDCLDHRPPMFHVQDELWAAHGAGDRILCTGCLEKRMGRPLAIQDFTDAPVNDHIRLGHAIALRDAVPASRAEALAETIMEG